MMFVVTENMFNNVPFFNFMEKHNSVNRSVSIGLKPDDGVCLIRKYQVFEICIYIFSFFSWNQKKIFKEFFHVCTFKLKLRDTYFDCESKIIIWIMCVYLYDEQKKHVPEFFLQTFCQQAKRDWNQFFYTKRHTKYGVILTTLIFMFLALDLYSRSHEPNHFVPWWQISVKADINRVS